jgi:hypothetical protein
MPAPAARLPAPQPVDERDEILEIAREFKTALRPHLARLGLSGLSGRLAQAATGAVLYLSEITPAMPADARQRGYSSALSCMVETATVLELLRARGQLRHQEFHRLRILAIRCTHPLSRLAAPNLGLLRLTQPVLRVPRPAA